MNSDKQGSIVTKDKKAASWFAALVLSKCAVNSVRRSVEILLRNSEADEKSQYRLQLAKPATCAISHSKSRGTILSFAYINSTATILKCLPPALVCLGRDLWAAN